MEDAPGPAHESVFICFFVNLYILIPTPPKTCIHCSCVFLTLAISKSPVIILALSVCCLFLWFVCVCVFVSFCLVFYLAVPSLSCGIRDLSCGMGTLSCGMWEFPDQGLNPHLLRWENGVLTTGPPGKSLCISFYTFTLAPSWLHFLCRANSARRPFCTVSARPGLSTFCAQL